MKTIISIIAAMAKNRVIGKDNDMPWGRLPVDLKHFKTITENHTVIMGRKTFESIGRPLPNRRNIILSSQNITIEGCEIASSINNAIEMVQREGEAFIIGGGFVYKEALPLADNLYLTHIDFEIEGDTYFPEYENLNLIEIENSKSKIDEKNKYECIFQKLKIVK